MEPLESFVKDSNITDYGWEYILSLAKTVAYRYYKTYDTEDLISLAVTDVAGFLLVLEEGDNTPRSIRNVLFTRARNCMSNYLYHSRKATPVEDEVLDTKASKEYETEDSEDLPFEYSFSTVEEAHILSLRLWRYYEGARETTNDSEYNTKRKRTAI